jgi:hypothetical protein
MSSIFYIGDDGNCVVRKVDASGIISTFAGTGVNGYTGDGGSATIAELTSAYGIACDSSGNLYISDGGATVRCVNTQASPITIYSVVIAPGNIDTVLNGVVTSGGALWFDASDNLYLSDFVGAVVIKVIPNGTTSVVAGNGVSGFSGDGGLATSAQLDGPQSAITDAAGNIYIVDLNNNRIRAVNTQGTTQTLLGVSIGAGNIDTVVGIGSAGYSGDSGAAIAAELNSPLDIKFDVSGNLYISDDGNNVVRKVTSAGIISTYAGNFGLGPGHSGDGGTATSAQLNGPFNLWFDSGNLYIVGASGSDQDVRMVDVGGIITTVAGTGTGGYSGDGGLATAAELSSPTAVFVLPPSPVAPDLHIDQTALTFDLTGVATDSQDIHITNTGAGALNYSIVSDVPWLTAVPSSGTAPDTVSVHVDTTTVVPQLPINVAFVTNGSFSDRIQLLLGTITTAFVGHLTVTGAGALDSPQTVTVTLNLSSVPYGPLAQAGPLADFDPRRDVEIYVDGVLVPIRTTFYNSAQDSYILLMDRAINVQGVIQAVHHMPNPPFVTATSTVFPSFAKVAIFVPTADELFVEGAAMGGVPDSEIFVNGALVSTDYVITINGE